MIFTSLHCMLGFIG